MRLKRIKLEDIDGYHHIICRCNGLLSLLKSVRAKNVLREMIEKAADFSGVQVITYCIMDDHFHLLVRIPASNSDISEEELFRRFKSLYGKCPLKMEAMLGMLRERQIRNAKRLDKNPEIEAYFSQLQKRMHDISEFMKTLKQRYTMWYNKTNNRIGTLWTERFKSMLFEDNPHLLANMAAYIDLNPVRARLCNDPRKYKWSGLYDFINKKGIYKNTANIISQQSKYSSKTFVGYQFYKDDVLPVIQNALITSADREAEIALAKKQINTNKPATADAISVSMPELLRSKVRLFSDGAIMGSALFMEMILSRFTWGPQGSLDELCHIRNYTFGVEKPALWIFKRLRGNKIQ